MRRSLKDNGIAILFLVLCLATIMGDAAVGHQLYNDEARANGEHTITFGRFLTSSEFGNSAMENWQSEFLQFATFIIATVWLVQRGSSESKPPSKAGQESDEEQKTGGFADPDSPMWARIGGIPQKLYENSLFLLMLLFFFATWLAQSLTGWTAYNSQLEADHQPTLSWIGYVGSADFWEATLQNWQSEFLAVGTMAIFAV